MDEVVASIEKVDSVVRVMRLSKEDNPNELLGRPDGYDHAAVFYDAGLTCAAPGIECGAFLEVWSDAAEAESRSGYLLALQDGTPGLGAEVHHVDGPYLLRLTDDLAPSSAEEYEQAFERS